MTVRKNGDWLAAKVGGQLLMMSATKGNYIGLNEVGTRIWELLEEPLEVEAICARLQEEYDISAETCRLEVEIFLKKAAEHGAVILDS